ncbi:MAG: hydrogenase maturation protease [Actinomycetota bacterium]
MTRRLIGIGNPDRGDDAAGWEVASRVTSWDVSRLTAGSLSLIDLWNDDDEVVIVDAMKSGAPAGTVVHIDAMATSIPKGTFSSTHAFGPAAVVELARTLDRLPRSLIVYGIEVGHVDHGVSMSPDVATAVDRVAMELQDA